MNTPDKVEEIVERFKMMFPCTYDQVSEDLTATHETYLKKALTQYHQDMMSEVVGKIEKMTVKQSTVNFKVNEKVMDFANNLLNEFKREAQTIIKSLSK